MNQDWILEDPLLPRQEKKWMLRSLSGQNFFEFSSDYRRYKLDEFLFLAKNLGVSWTEYHNIPTYARRYLVDKIIESQKKD